MGNQITLFGSNGAEFSPCGKYRYALWRVWDESLPYAMFIGLNPSTADASRDDPTIRRVKGFAKDWGFGGVYMLNLFGIISPYPEILLTAKDPIGSKTDEWLQKISQDAGKVFFAWGSFKEVKRSGRDKEVMEIVGDAFALRINKDGSPAHPLYIPKSVKPVRYE